jgi:dephospho-CoA kinase
MTPPVIGVTGSIGSGKTMFSSVLAGEKGKHLNADEIARDLIKVGNAAYEAVIEQFGSEIVDDQGHINKNKLAEKVFSDSDKLKRLEAIVHPLVKEKIEESISRANHDFYVVDAPLLFEAGFDELCQRVVVITAPSEQVKQRLAKRGIGAGEIKRRRRHQMSEQEKIARGDLIIDNSGSIEELKDKASRLREEIINRNVGEKSN